MMNQSGEDRFEIAFFDVETTVPTRPGQGFGLLEFGSILVCPRKLIELESYSTLIRPADLNSINSLSVRCNGITRDAVIAAPRFDEIADRVFDILHGRIWAGHNILRFDCPRIREAFAYIGRPAPEPKGTIDSLALLTQRFGRRAGNMKMASLATYFGLGQQTHRSLDDVRMNLEVLKYCATVLFLESSLPDTLTENSWVSPNATTRSRSGGKLSPEGSSMNTNISNQTGGNHPITSIRTETTQEVSDLLETVESSTNRPDPFEMGPLINEVKKELDQQDINMEETPAQGVVLSSESRLIESPAPGNISKSSLYDPLKTELMAIDSMIPIGHGQQELIIGDRQTSKTAVASCSLNAAVSNNCNSTVEFLQLDHVSIPSISTSLVPFNRGIQRIKLLHKDATLQLCCNDMKLRFGINPKFFDHAGRPRLNIVFDAPPKLCEVLDVCDGLAQKLSLDSGSSSEWRPVVFRKEGFYNYPTVRLHIQTAVCGDIAIYTTEIYQREPSGTEQRLVFSKFDASELSALFTRGMFMDVFFSLDPYDYQQSAGIRLVARKLIIHSS